jgi:hypothetical protein
MILSRNDFVLYSYAVDTPAWAATLRKLISTSSDCICRIEVEARDIAPSLRDRALRFRPARFLAMMRLQCRDDVDEACSFPGIHLALSYPAVRIGLCDDALCLTKFGEMNIEEGSVGSTRHPPPSPSL